MARQKRQSVNDWEERNKRSMEGFTHETTESTRVANRRGYDRYLQWKAQKEQKEREDIISRINDFASRSSQFASEARKRSGTDRYRTDSQDWLTSSQERSDSMRQEAKEIGDLLFQNQSAFDRDTFEKLSGMIRGSRKNNSQVVKAAENEVRYFSQWDSEEDYNKYQQQKKDYEAKRNFDTEEGRREIARIQNDLKEYQSLSRWETDEKGRQRLEELKKQYGGEQGIRDLISQKNVYLTEAERIQKGERLSGVGQKGSEVYDPKFMLSSNANKDIEDVQYRYINDEAYRQQYQKLLGDGYDNFAEAGLDILTDDERRTYNYYYAKGGKEAAQEYLTSIRETLNYRKAAGVYEDLEDNILLELAFGVEAGIDQWQSGMSSLINNTEGTYMAPSARQIASGMVREDLAEKGKIASGAYDLITTTANMAPSILSSTVANILLPGSGTYVGSAMMGASATGSAYQEMINAGYTKDQARAYGTMVGASEAILGNLLGGISSLGGKASGHVIKNLMSKVDNVVARTAIKIGGNMLSEGFEEGLQEVLTPWFKSLLTHEEYAAAPEDVLYAGLLGALSAGLLEGPTTIAGEHGTYRQGLDLQAADIAPKRLAEIGQTFSADTVAYQLAGRVNESTDAYTLGRLFNEIDAELTQANEDSIVNGLVSRGMDESSARKLAKGFGAVVTGTPMTDRQMMAIGMNDILAQTIREDIIDPNSTVYQRNQSFNEVLRTLAEGGAVSAPEAVAESAPTDMASEEPVAESPYEAPVDGKTILKSTGETVEIRDVAGVKDGRMTFNLQDGRTVSADEVSLGSEGDAMVYGAIAEMNVHPKVANVLMDNFRLENTDAEVYAKGIQEAYRFGENNYPMSMAAKGPFTSMLTPRQRNTAYQMGQLFGTEKVKQRQAAIMSASVKNTGSGKVHFDGDRTALNKRQQVSLSALDRVASAMGAQIYIYDSKSDSSLAGKNGWYDPSDNSIHIDLHAGEQGKDTMLFTAAHELTHLIKEWNAEKFKAISDFLMQEYGKLDVNVDELVQKQILAAKENGRELTQEQAFEEVIANSMEEMLADGNVVEKLEKLKAQDRSLWEKIRDYVKKLAVKIRSVFEGIQPESEEAKYVAQMKDAIEELQNLFAEGLSGAGENYQAAMERDISETQAEQDDRDMKEVKFSDRQNPYYGKSLYKDGEIYTYDFMVALHDMEVYTMPPLSSVKTDNRVDQNKAVQLGLGNASSVGRKVSDGLYAIKNSYTGREILLGKAGLEHGLDGGDVGRLRTNARLSAIGGLIVQNSIPMNGLKNKNRQANGTYAMACLLKSGDRDVVAIVTVEEHTSKAVDIDFVDITHSINGRLRKNSEGSLSSTRETGYGLTAAPSAATFKVSIAEFLEIVNETHRSILSQNVLDHFNEERPSDGHYSDRVLFSDRNTVSASSREKLAEAFEGLAQTELERKKVREYREKAAQYDEQEQKLRELRGQIKELSFAKGPRDKQKLRELRDEATRTANRINIYDKQLLRLEASAPLKAVLDREKARAAKREAAKRREAMEVYRDDRKRVTVLHKVQKIAKDLDSLLNSESKKRHVPDNMKKAVADALATVNMNTYDSNAKITKYKALIAQTTDPDKIQAYQDAIIAEQDKAQNIAARMEALRQSYDAIRNSDDPDIAGAHDDVVAGNLEELSNSIKNTPLGKMSVEQMEDVYSMFKMVLTRVRDANKLLTEGRTGTIRDQAAKSIQEIRISGGEKKFRASALDGVKKFLWDNQKPIYAMEKIGSKTMTNSFMDLIRGEGVYGQDVSGAAQYAREQINKHGYQKWDMAKKHSFTSTSGLKYELTLEQMLTLYAYSKLDDAPNHLQIGGFVFDKDIETYKVKEGKKSIVKYKVNTAKAHQISRDILTDIVNKLSADQRAFADEMIAYLSDTMGAKGNEVSMKLYGIKLFRRKNYFPLKCASEYMERKEQKTDAHVKIKNSGFTNKINPRANNPVVLRNFMDIWAEHVHEMSMYHAFTLPLEDFSRIFEYHYPMIEGTTPVSVKSTIQNAYGPEAVRYVENLIDDLNGGARSDPRENIAKQMMGIFKTDAVMGSLSVVIQQPSALLRAQALVDAKYFLGRKVEKSETRNCGKSLSRWRRLHC